MSDIRDIFISYVEEDSSVAIELARGLEDLGYTTWYYGRDSIPGMSYLLQTHNAIINCRVVALVLSDHSLNKSKQVDKEVVRTLESDKSFLPILVNISWTEFQKRQPTWAQAIGGIVGIGITEQGVAAILPRLAAGLKGLGVLPQTDEGSSPIASIYPFPVAAAYAQNMKRSEDPQQAFQAHANLGEMTDALIKTIAALVISFYRQGSLSAGKEDSEVEKELADLLHPQLETWLSLLHTTLSLYGDAPHPLLGKVHAFFYEKSHRKDAVSEAAASLATWLGQPQRKPPISYQDLFELLVQYRSHPDGWASTGAAHPSQEYQQRFDLLHQALEAALTALSFLAEYRLVSVLKTGSAPNSYRILDGTGRDLTPASEDFISAKALELGHTYLCQKEGNDWQTFIDLYPLGLVQECKGCRQNSLFFLAQNRDQRLDFSSPTCRHRLEPGESALPGLEADLKAYLALEDWRAHIESPPQGNTAPYLTALREVLRNAEIDPQERGKLEFLAKMLRLSPETATRLEAQVVEELKPAPVVEPILPVQPVIPIEPAQPVEEKRLVQVWQHRAGQPISHLAVFGSPPLILACDLSGCVQIFNEQQQLVYEDRVEGRPYQVLSLEDRALVSTWKGYLYCFGTQELLWQHGSNSPISALAVCAGDNAIAAGGWDGEVRTFSRSGSVLWKAHLEDGISTLALSSEGDLLAIGTYGGQMCMLGDGQKLWLQDARSAVVALTFSRHARHLIIARRDRILARMDAENQALLWDFTLEKAPLSLGLSTNDRRLVLTSGEGDLLNYTLDGAPNLRHQAHIPGLSQVALLPFSAEGNLLLALGAEGVWLLDLRAKTQSLEINTPQQHIAISKEGDVIALAGAETLSLFRLGKPLLSAVLEPLSPLNKGRFTRLRITLRNSGERLARNIEFSLEGPVDCKPTGLPAELKPGETAISEKQSLQPLADGDLPVYVRIKYSDDFGIRHEHTDRLVLESAAGG